MSTHLYRETDIIQTHTYVHADIYTKIGKQPNSQVNIA